ncbi:MAG TPA: EXLDI protein [Candidatus Sulfotelmatobacter sp.]|jgi:EXLDI family protein|nr:EXLDI protein [Candidatus Sulfotelmatobacter sp.]
MSNKTIYVSEKDEPLFDRAKEIAGEALSSVIARALGEYVSRHEKKERDMKEITIKVGKHTSQRKLRFIGHEVGKWSGFSDDKVWLMSAKIYQTQKGKWAILIQAATKATLLTNPIAWKKNADYLENTNGAEFIVGDNFNQLKNKLPKSLYVTLQEIAKQYESPIEYLDI